MTTYSFLFIDRDEIIDKIKNVSCDSDEQAMVVAKGEAADSRAIEVWDRDRLVFLFANSLRTHAK
jgi:hypothetical protein